MMTQLRDNIVRSLGIGADLFTLSMLEEIISEIPPEQYQDFFNALHGEQHQFLRGLDRVQKVAKLLKENRNSLLLSGTYSKAKEIADRFYAIRRAISDLAELNMKECEQKNFFNRVIYKDVKIHGEPISKQELYVLEKLGGGSWLYGLIFESNSGVVVEKIDQIIRDAILEKQQKQIGKSDMKRIGA
jgi:hypothetical protein